MAEERDVDGWSVDTGQFATGADRQTRHGTVDLEVRPDGLYVDIDEGRGYMNTRLSTFVPMRVLEAVLKQVGYMLVKSVADQETEKTDAS